MTTQQKIDQYIDGLAEQVSAEMKAKYGFDPAEEGSEKSYIVLIGKDGPVDCKEVEIKNNCATTEREVKC